MANKVEVSIVNPDPTYVKGKAGDSGYVARFCKESKQGGPVHVGPTIRFRVLDPAGKVIQENSAAVTLSSTGVFGLRSLQEAVADLEKEKK